MIKTIPAQKVEVCDVCERVMSISGLLTVCLVCGRAYCRTCEGMFSGCIHQPDVCKKCAEIPSVNKAVLYCAKPLERILKQRAGCLVRLGNQLRKSNKPSTKQTSCQH